MLLPTLVALKRVGFVVDEPTNTTVDLEARHAALNLGDLLLEDGDPAEAA